VDGGSRNRQAHILNALILAWIWVFTLLKWPELPEEIPVHFTLAGEPDRWAAKTWEHWFVLPIVALGMTALLYLASRLVVRFPQHANLPQKAVFLRLPPEDRRPILDVLTGLLYRVAALINVQFGVMQLATYRVAVGQSPGLPGYVKVASVVIVLLVLVLTLTTILNVRSMILARAASQDRGPGLRGEQT